MIFPIFEGLFFTYPTRNLLGVCHKGVRRVQRARGFAFNSWSRLSEGSLNIRWTLVMVYKQRLTPWKTVADRILLCFHASHPPVFTPLLPIGSYDPTQSLHRLHSLSLRGLGLGAADVMVGWARFHLCTPRLFLFSRLPCNLWIWSTEVMSWCQVGRAAQMLSPNRTFSEGSGVS